MNKEAMYRFLVLMTAFLFINSCGSFQYQKSISLGDGRSADIFYETETTESGELILQIEYTNEQLVRKESKVEQDVLRIWDELKIEAENREIEEAVVRYRYLTGEIDQEGKKIYEGLLFTADRTETGKWLIRKVN